MIPLPKYKLEFILHAYNTTSGEVKNSLAEFGSNLEVLEMPDSATRGRDFKVNLNTEDPTVVFDVCAQFGRIRSVKVEEEGGVK